MFNFFEVCILVCLFLGLKEIDGKIEETCIKEAPKFKCPNTTLTADTREDLIQITASIIELLWNRPLQNWSPDALKLRDITKTLLRGTNYWEFTYAHSFTIWMALFQRRLESAQPSACAFQEAINAIIQCHRDKNSYGIINNNLERPLHLYAAHYFIIDGFKSVACPSGKNALVPQWKCCDKGLTYDIEYIWNTYNPNLPSNLKEIVLKLYNSDEFIDRFLAALATYSILSTTKVTPKLDQTKYLELISLLVGPEVEKRCCETMRKRIVGLVDYYLEGVMKYMDIRKETFSTTNRLSQYDNGQIIHKYATQILYKQT
ncbi:uncharacterized protein LOC143912115 [Arctopsyche grandis]|uniref:uncharacterized protein LOC143912115 n=1 Tax=Arctopsyche grandis TaxID=121162 RepID=UPI00406D68DE